MNIYSSTTRVFDFFDSQVAKPSTTNKYAVNELALGRHVASNALAIPVETEKQIQ